MTSYSYIVIEGNIGAGKTSLTSRIAEELSARLILEEFADNPFLPKFYENPERYAFPLELSFLSERFSQLKKDLITEDMFAPKVLSDYFISKCQIFAKNNLHNDEYNLFLKMFEIVESNTPKPDLLVYLYQNVDQLLMNIQKRGRDYEKHITAEYLENIQQQYLEFIRQHSDMRVVIIDTTNLDFVNRDEDYKWIKEKVLSEYPIGISRISI
jgi:deoxyguanosine kinase